jgi:hypothetical protein
VRTVTRKELNLKKLKLNETELKKERRSKELTSDCKMNKTKPRREK